MGEKAEFQNEWLEPGHIWRESEKWKERPRYIKIIPPGAVDCSVYWTYCDADGKPEPHGYEPANGHTYGDWWGHHCDLFDFVVWGRFKFVR